MRRQNDRLVPQRQQFGVHGIVQLSGVLAGLRWVRQVGPPGLADEQRVAGEHRPRVVGGVVEMDRVAHALRRVTRRVQRDDPDALGQLEPLAIVEPDVPVAERVVAPVDHLCATLAHKLGRTHHKILLAMGLKRILDRQLVLAGQLQILVHIPARINHRGFSPIPDQVGDMGDAGGLDALEVHGT